MILSQHKHQKKYRTKEEASLKAGQNKYSIDKAEKKYQPEKKSPTRHKLATSYKT
jgi:hypothetical protein